ncbi:MAG: putative sulfate/molybdate transporter [Nitrospinae bacterium]|nr:putative sulfate/molybdate transporter [Nitrospinota bacterium]
MKTSIRFDRNEWSGAFGDIGTDLPLITGMILVSGIDAASVLIVFGIMQILTAWLYGIPMPVQPLKAVAAIVIAERLTGSVIYGAGLAIGFTMLFLTVTGLIDWLGRVIPKAVIRGIQFGLGAKLSLLALTNFVQAEGATGYVLAAIAFVMVIGLLGNRKYPPALFVIMLGLLYSFLFKTHAGILEPSFRFALPQLHAPSIQDIFLGFFVLALPQIPLSLGNSIYATKQIANDLFPEKEITVRKIGLTYSLMNIVAPFMGGVPVCHGSGGMAGHYAFGGRTGGSVVIYGSMYLLLGLFFSGSFNGIITIFPLPILGVILFFEGLTLMRLIEDTVYPRAHLSIALLVGLIAVGLPYGFLIGMIVGTLLAFVSERYQIGFSRSQNNRREE